MCGFSSSKNLDIVNKTNCVASALLTASGYSACKEPYTSPA